jgi:hypothetical protein
MCARTVTFTVLNDTSSHQGSIIWVLSNRAGFILSGQISTKYGRLSHCIATSTRQNPHCSGIRACPPRQSINYRTTSHFEYADTPNARDRQFCGQCTIKSSIDYIPYCIILSSSSGLPRTSAPWPISKNLQLLDAPMGEGPTRDGIRFFPFLGGQPTDRGSTNNIHVMSQIDYHASDHEFRQVSRWCSFPSPCQNPPVAWPCSRTLLI